MSIRQDFAAGVDFRAQPDLAREEKRAAADSSFPQDELSGISRGVGDAIARPPTEQGPNMDHSESSAEAAGLPVTGASWRVRPAFPLPPDFVPLRLVLQPSGASVELTQPDMLLGRHSQADIRLPLPDVSRRHCRFIFSEGVWQVLDLNSLNGVFVNGEPVRQSSVRAGDLLRIGGFTFAVEFASPPNADASEGLIRGIFRSQRRSA